MNREELVKEIAKSTKLSQKSVSEVIKLQDKRKAR